MMIVRESDFEFDFVNARIEKLEGQKPEPHGFQLVDFIIEEENRLVMLEIKNPSCKPKSNDEKALAGIKAQRNNFVLKIHNGELINHELVPKARDSYTYIHLMARDAKPILYVFLLGAGQLQLEEASLLAFKDDMLARLRQEAGQPWARHYVADCLVLTEQTWRLAFPEYALARIS
jgi:hypothetical protein